MKRIIIADDAALARMFTRKCLTIAGLSDAEFIEAENGAAVLNLLSNVEPDLIITDLYMPELNGLELVRKLKEDNIAQDVPIVVVTSAGSAEQREELKELGVAAILTKPINPMAISQILAAVFPDMEEDDNDAW